MEAVEARTDTKITRMEGKLDLVLLAIDAARQDTHDGRGEMRDNRRAITANIWAAFIGLVALIIGISILGPVIFDLGFTA